MTIRDLEKAFRRAQRTGQSVTLVVEIPGMPEPEKITNPVANLDMKLKYYQDTYTPQLEHRAVEGLRIVGIDSPDLRVKVGVEIDMEPLDIMYEKLKSAEMIASRLGGMINGLNRR